MLVFFPIRISPLHRKFSGRKRLNLLGKNINRRSLNGRVINLRTRGRVCTKYFHRLPLDGLVYAIDSLDGLLDQPAHNNGPHTFSTKAITSSLTKQFKTPVSRSISPKKLTPFRPTHPHRPLPHLKSGKFSISSSESSMAILLPIPRASCGFFS